MTCPMPLPQERLPVRGQSAVSVWILAFLFFLGAGSLRAEDGDAADAAGTAQAEGPAPEDLLAQAKELAGKEDVEGALTLLNQVIEADASFYPVWMERGRLHAGRNQILKAYSDYARVVALVDAMTDAPPASQQAHRDASAQLRSLGRMAEVIHGLHNTQAQELRQQARQHEEGGRPFSALRFYALALQINPEDAVAAERVKTLSASLGHRLADVAMGGHGRQSLFDGKTLAGWRIRTGRWEVDKEELRIRSGGATYLFHEGPWVEDMVFEADIKVGTNAYGYILVRSDYEGGGYAFGIQRGESRSPEGHVVDIRWSLQAHRNEAITSTRRIFNESSPARMRIDPGRWYTVRLEARGSVVTGYVNGQKWFEEKNATRSGGSVGLWGNHVSYRNLRLTRLFAAPPDTETGEDGEGTDKPVSK